MEKTIFYTDAKGNKVPVKVNVNKNLNKKNSKLKKGLAVTALVLAIGAGTLVGCNIWNQYNNEKDSIPTTNTTLKQDDLNESLRFEPNSQENIVNNAVLLIKEAAKSGKELDAEDAVLAVIAINSNELSAGFMGELFGERADQTYTYNSIVDAYLRVCMMQNENVGFAQSDEELFSIENTFANQEDYMFLCNLRELTTRFNNSTDAQEKTEIANQLNQIAVNLCGYDVYDISSSASVVAMLTLDGMRTITVNSETTILHDDIRDEMFGNGDYACIKDGMFSTTDGQLLPTAYSNKVSDLKLDTIKNKLDNAVLAEGKTVILDEIIAQVTKQTKDLAHTDIDPNEQINKRAEENRDVTYEYESEPGVAKENYSKKTDTDVVQNVNGKDVIVVDNEKTSINDSKQEASTSQTPSVPEITIPNGEATTPQSPEITIEENVTPEKGEEIFANKEEAEENLQNEWEKAQAESIQGSIDGEYYGKNGLSKPSFEGKSEFYINAFNPNYEFWYNKYLSAQPAATAESYDLDSLSKEQLEELKNAAMGYEDYTQSEEKTK